MARLSGLRRPVDHQTALSALPSIPSSLSRFNRSPRRLAAVEPEPGGPWRLPRSPVLPIAADQQPTNPKARGATLSGETDRKVAARLQNRADVQALRRSRAVEARRSLPSKLSNKGVRRAVYRRIVQQQG